MSEDEEYQQIQNEQNFQKAYQKLIRRMNNQSAGASSLLLSQAKNGLETTFNNGNNHQCQNGTDKRFNQSEFEMRTREF